MSDAAVVRPSGREVAFSRLIAAPAAVLWDAWSDPRHLAAWYGPAGYTITTVEFALVTGGVWRFTMHGPDGVDTPNLVVFRVVEPMRRLSYENRWDRPGARLDFTVDVTFAPEGQRTRLTLHMTFADDEAMRVAVERYGVLQGGVDTFARIARFVERITSSA